jgi:hypothetical protein
MDSLDVETLQQQVVAMAQGMPDWLEVLRYLILAALLTLAFWIWRKGNTDTVGRNIWIIVGGMIVVVWLNLEIWIYAGRLDVIGLMSFLPLIYITAKTMSDRMT